LSRTHFARPVRRTDLPISGWERDAEPELGFIPALLGALGSIPMVGNLVESLTGGGKSAAAPAGIDPSALLGSLSSAAGGAVNPEAFKGMVSEVMRSVSPPVRQQVTDAIREQLNSIRAGEADLGKIMSDIVAQIGPALSQQLKAVDQAALQRQATYEHEALKRTESRWKSNADAQRLILARLSQLESSIGTAVERSGVRARALATAYGAPK
jgi:hypothetical protein